MGNMEALYNTWKAIGVSGGDLSFFQNFFVKFYQAFIEADRWLQYLNGVKTTSWSPPWLLILGASPWGSRWPSSAPPTTSSAPATATPSWRC